MVRLWLAHVRPTDRLDLGDLQPGDRRPRQAALTPSIVLPADAEQTTVSDVCLDADI
jgi:hypothetical protein